MIDDNGSAGGGGLGGHLGWGWHRLDLRRSVGNAKRPQNSRSPALDLSDQIGKRPSVFVARRSSVELALGVADLVEKLTQLSFDQVGPVRCRLRDHDRLELVDRRQQLPSVGVPVPARVFSEKSAAALKKAWSSSSFGARRPLACAMVSAGMSNPWPVYQSCGFIRPVY
jgi:hypothetical protein